MIITLTYGNLSLEVNVSHRRNVGQIFLINRAFFRKLTINTLADSFQRYQPTTQDAYIPIYKINTLLIEGWDAMAK